ncbi:MAG: TetR family transcriptional regulator [Actinomycetota bacterium]
MGTAVLQRELSSVGDQTRAQILDAAFASAVKFGLARTTMGDVASEARLSRQTVYRYFPTKHDLFLALILREEQSMICAVQQAMLPHAELQPAMERAFEAMLKALRAHPLLDRVMASEPQELLPYLTVDMNPVLEVSTKIMEEIARTRAPRVSPRIRKRWADTCARVFTSYAINPPKPDAARVAAELAELFCKGLES